jgi:hypothetical protein
VEFTIVLLCDSPTSSWNCVIYISLPKTKECIKIGNEKLEYLKGY